ncbi:MAG: Rpn family recombination-promoting nuclease/putative transposase [Rickettsia endosymbiont of Ixodes persulcatus]|nr:Rpn family recombination-promoting nuclease/putative transposase [Rickettsia endosymbiont of Ixodes persulcatus]MCZ6910124.1 Rpn family recombination-promoting nuclease/putative transposase [Rickettsia endosymbiont of Ixodes persulcatus]MCZ6913541.1 Rpn family recombination-promoting nuclease/putative transposase [Rickettsia endosymbiont of Ixodes persulcatus]MCZ6920140.1 Rpn family recombination-promoting nuclease/putative transposase [Rickettsia endosymbiont of Ixodes persulcatus]
MTQDNNDTNNSDESTSGKPKHDAIIRKAFENPIVAKEFFEMHLPKEIKTLFSASTLKIEKESFVEADLKHSISDILFSAKFNDDTGYLWILLEHQSTPDHFMAFRLFKYYRQTFNPAPEIVNIYLLSIH